ncbi:MAG: hypothetical protein WD847_21315 [Pirellulales bacterium]
MNMNHSLEQQLEQLGRELGDSAGLTERVMARLAQQENKLPVQPARSPRRRWRWPAAAVLAASVAVCVGAWWLSRPTTLYARMIIALAQANTVHASGWTRHIVRKWPLEDPLEQPGGGNPDQKYPLDIWYWTEADGTPRGYERAGPVILVRHGGDYKEYQADTDLMYVVDGSSDGKDKVAEFGRLATYLTALERPSLTKHELGLRRENGRWVRGIQHIEGNRIEEIWIDEKTSLPARLLRKAKDTGLQMMELTFTVDEPIPETVAEFDPPNTRYVRFSGGGKGNEQWRQHVAEVGRRLEMKPIDGRIAILPREQGRTFSNQWSMMTPDGTYWLRPLDRDQYAPMTLAGFVGQHAATEGGERRHGTWRLAKQLRDIELPRADLVHEADVPWQEWVPFVLNHFGLEFIEQVEHRTIWIAKHDGRELKPWQEVKPPAPYVIEGGVEKKGYVKPGIGMAVGPTTLQELFSTFNRQMGDLDADKPWIIDETGLPMPPPYSERQHGPRRAYREEVLPSYYVATDVPWFAGRESIEMARQWYAKEFGIRFTEKVRPVTVHVIRRKSAG